jgi:hypothetical protein
MVGSPISKQKKEGRPISKQKTKKKKEEDEPGTGSCRRRSELRSVGVLGLSLLVVEIAVE